MSLISWFQAKKPTPRASGATRQRKSYSQTALPPISPRRGRRMLRREQLFAVVRESMIRGGVLSTSYDFKVLTLDANGDSFLVLIELALPVDVMPEAHLQEIERWVQASAQSRHSMSIASVYWRRKAAPDPCGTVLKAKAAAQTRRTAVADGPTSLAAPPLSTRMGEAQAVDAAELAAFRQALAAGAAPLRPGTSDSPDRLLPVPESHSDFSALSATQYGKH